MKNAQKFLAMFLPAIVILVVIVGFISTTLFSVRVPEATGPSDAAAVQTKIENATKIYAEKALFSFGDSWEIYADDEAVGVVHGEFIKGIGDTYSLYTTNGHFVGAEEEKFAFIGTKARMYDADKKDIGSVTQNIINFMPTLDIERGGKQVGSAKQNVSAGFSATIRDADGTATWEVRKKVFSANAKVTVTKSTDTEVSGMDAMWAALIMHEIVETKAD